MFLRNVGCTQQSTRRHIAEDDTLHVVGYSLIYYTVSATDVTCSRVKYIVQEFLMLKGRCRGLFECTVRSAGNEENSDNVS
jgi:hypothetical protein